MDVLGIALLDYVKGLTKEDIKTFSELGGWDELPLDYLFRSFDQMPIIEQKALELSRGRILDIGCGAGSHSLYLQSVEKEVLALDNSKGAVEVCKQRGLENVILADINSFNPDHTFDTLLLLMNGIGLAGTLKSLPDFLLKLKELIKPDGQILLDSSDVVYMFDQDEDGGYWIDASKGYYGETHFQMHYNNMISESFPWLYIDFQSLKEIADQCGLKAELIQEGEHYDYLSRLTLESDRV